MTKFYDIKQLKKFENGIEVKITNCIKEILDLFYNEYPREEKKLQKYITNLQEENKQLREHYLYMQEEMCLRWNELDNLQNEISDLKDTIKNKNNCIEAYDCIIKSRDERIDKAIKYIKKNIPYWEEWHYDMVIDTEDMNKIIDILRGDE